MPYINFSADPVSFRDDPSEKIMGPIRQNMMSLAQTFATEVPRLQMEQNRIQQEQQFRAHSMNMQDQELARQNANDKYQRETHAAAMSRQVGLDTQALDETHGQRFDTMMQNLAHQDYLRAHGNYYDAGGARGAAARGGQPEAYDTANQQYLQTLEQRKGLAAKLAAEKIRDANGVDRLLTQTEIQRQVDAAIPAPAGPPTREGDSDPAAGDPFAGGNAYPARQPQGSPPGASAQVRQSVPSLNPLQYAKLRQAYIQSQANPGAGRKGDPTLYEAAWTALQPPGDTGAAPDAAGVTPPPAFNMTAGAQGAAAINKALTIPSDAFGRPGLPGDLLPEMSGGQVEMPEAPAMSPAPATPVATPTSARPRAVNQAADDALTNARLLVNKVRFSGQPGFNPGGGVVTGKLPAPQIGPDAEIQARRHLAKLRVAYPHLAPIIDEAMGPSEGDMTPLMQIGSALTGGKSHVQTLGKVVGAIDSTRRR